MGVSSEAVADTFLQPFADTNVLWKRHTGSFRYVWYISGILPMSSRFGKLRYLNSVPPLLAVSFQTARQALKDTTTGSYLENIGGIVGYYCLLIMALAASIYLRDSVPRVVSFRMQASQEPQLVGGTIRSHGRIYTAICLLAPIGLLALFDVPDWLDHDQRAQFDNDIHQYFPPGLYYPLLFMCEGALLMGALSGVFLAHLMIDLLSVTLEEYRDTIFRDTYKATPDSPGIKRRGRGQTVSRLNRAQAIDTVPEILREVSQIVFPPLLLGLGGVMLIVLSAAALAISRLGDDAHLLLWLSPMLYLAVISIIFVKIWKLQLDILAIRRGIDLVRPYGSEEGKEMQAIEASASTDQRPGSLLITPGPPPPPNCELPLQSELGTEDAPIVKTLHIPPVPRRVTPPAPSARDLSQRQSLQQSLGREGMRKVIQSQGVISGGSNSRVNKGKSVTLLSLDDIGAEVAIDDDKRTIRRIVTTFDFSFKRIAWHYLTLIIPTVLSLAGLSLVFMVVETVLLQNTDTDNQSYTFTNSVYRHLFALHYGLFKVGGSQSFPFVLCCRTFGLRNLSRGIKLTTGIYYVLMIAFAVASVYFDFDLKIKLLYTIPFVIYIIYLAIHVGIDHDSWRLAVDFFLPTMLAAIVGIVYGFLVLPLYARSGSRGVRIITRIVVHGGSTLIHNRLFRVLGRRLAMHKCVESSYEFYMVFKAASTLIGRLLINNLDSLSDTIILSILVTIFDMLARTTRFVRTQLGTKLFRNRKSTLNDLMEPYLGPDRVSDLNFEAQLSASYMVCELNAIIVSTLFIGIYQGFYTTRPTNEIVLFQTMALVIQLFVAVLGDLTTMYMEERYMYTPVSVVIALQAKHQRTSALLLATTPVLFFLSRYVALLPTLDQVT